MNPRVLKSRFHCPRYGRGVLTRWQGGLAAIAVTLGTVTLVILDLADTGVRAWGASHAITTDTVAGLLVLLITVLVVDQVVSIRQLNDRARAIAAQAAIVVTQARRTTQAVSEAINPHDGRGDRDAAVDEFRTYMMMLLVAAPVLIDAKVSRDFLEQAQVLGAELAKALAATAKPADGAAKPADGAAKPADGAAKPADGAAKAPGRTAGAGKESAARLNEAVQRLRDASTPLLQVLDPDTRSIIRGDPPA
jgi:hypothetical protein